MEVDSHVGAAMSGLIADARTLVDHARVEAQNHRFVRRAIADARAGGLRPRALLAGTARPRDQGARPFDVALSVADAT